MDPEELELQNDYRYRHYEGVIEKALRNFESSSEWADLISSLGKLNKVSSSETFSFFAATWWLLKKCVFCFSILFSFHWKSFVKAPQVDLILFFRPCRVTSVILSCLSGWLLGSVSPSVCTLPCRAEFTSRRLRPMRSFLKSSAPNGWPKICLFTGKGHGECCALCVWYNLGFFLFSAQDCSHSWGTRPWQWSLCCWNFTSATTSHCRGLYCPVFRPSSLGYCQAWRRAWRSMTGTSHVPWTEYIIWWANITGHMPAAEPFFLFLSLVVLFLC